MAEKLGLFIKPNAPLIEDNLIERAKKLTSSLLSDGMESFGAMDYEIKPVGLGRKVVGTAITVNVRSGDNLLLHKAIYLASKGYVLVADGKGELRSAAWGDMMTRSSVAQGIEGVVIDGVVRDLVDLREINFPVFAKGAIPSGINKFGPGEINGPISCGGVSVNPGDLILGDDDGVIVVPRDKIEEVLNAAEAKAIKDEERIQEILNGNPEPSWINERLKNLGL